MQLHSCFAPKPPRAYLPSRAAPRGPRGPRPALAFAFPPPPHVAAEPQEPRARGSGPLIKAKKKAGPWPTARAHRPPAASNPQSAIAIALGPLGPRLRLSAQRSAPNAQRPSVPGLPQHRYCQHQQPLATATASHSFLLPLSWLAADCWLCSGCAPLLPPSSLQYLVCMRPVTAQGGRLAASSRGRGMVAVWSRRSRASGPGDGIWHLASAFLSVMPLT
jgi:hypothetical protein